MKAQIRRWLANSPSSVLTFWAAVMAFSTYFCMYAFRKPFAAGTYEGVTFLGSEVELKTAIVISQILGYALSKYIGIKVCSEVRRKYRQRAILLAILVAQGALLLFAILPEQWKVAAIFFNGLPLGMIWGFVVLYLEGRRSSEIQLAGLSCSFIIASGVVKDVGRYLMSHNVPEYWMPFATGMVFLPLLLLSTTLLDAVPDPDKEDVEERVKRQPMSGADRTSLLRRFALGFALLFLVYVGLTAYRDFRDNYGVEIFAQLGYGDTPGLFTRSEFWVALGVLAVLAPLSWIRDNRRALAAVYGLMIAGCLLIGGSTFLLQMGAISGLVWMILAGLGVYLAYVPFGSVLFDRLIAATGTVGTAVFAIYVADALGYTGSVALQLVKDLFQAGATRLEFFLSFSYILAIAGVVLLLISLIDFGRAARKNRAPQGT